MGVKGLLKYIRNCHTGVRPEPLVLSTETKRKSRDPTAEKAILVCDFIAIVFWLLDIVHDAKKSSERYIALYGADFKEYTSRLIRFVEMLRHIDIEPVFFWDGPRGSGKEYEMKLSTWEKRAKDSLEVILSHSLITKYDAKTEVKFGKKIKRPLLVTELVMVLQEAKVELLTCRGEADNMMAEYMRVYGNVCGILTNDTDMMLMHGVTAIHYKLFDQREKLPPRISARPGPKGVTMSSHLMITLTHARWFLSLLGIHQELPLPSSVFQPYIYIPLHGTAFKLKQKEKFYGDDAPAKEYYELLSKGRVFQDFKRCICSGSAIDNIGAVCVQYARTKDAIKELLDKKARSSKTSKSRKK
uniref:Asteroid domain-containing protein n=1 Tax=Amphimedon queenslandica TaxID=400682 RepID=A0A1X7UD54_AMPQE